MSQFQTLQNLYAAFNKEAQVYEVIHNARREATIKSLATSPKELRKDLAVLIEAGIEHNTRKIWIPYISDSLNNSRKNIPFKVVDMTYFIGDKKDNVILWVTGQLIRNVAKWENHFHGLLSTDVELSWIEEGK